MTSTDTGARLITLGQVAERFGVSRRTAQRWARAGTLPALRQPIWGWWGRRAMFEMEQGFEPLPDVRANLSGTPPVLSGSTVMRSKIITPSVAAPAA